MIKIKIVRFFFSHKKISNFTLLVVKSKIFFNIFYDFPYIKHLKVILLFQENTHIFMTFEVLFSTTNYHLEFQSGFGRSLFGFSFNVLDLIRSSFRFFAFANCFFSKSSYFVNFILVFGVYKSFLFRKNSYCMISFELRNYYSSYEKGDQR